MHFFLADNMYYLMNGVMIISTFKIHKDEKDKIKRSADMSGESYSEYIRKAANLRVMLEKMIRNPHRVERLLSLVDEEPKK